MHAGPKLADVPPDTVPDGDVYATFADACARAGIGHPEFWLTRETPVMQPWEPAPQPEHVAQSMYQTGPMPALPAGATIEGRVIAS